MWAEINGIRLFYEVRGSGPAIMTLHGGPGISDHRSNLAAFGDLADSFTVVAYDHRGSGLSEGEPPFSHEQWVADCEALRRHLGLGKVVMIGGSYGGFLTLEYALRYPENLAAVILRDTAASFKYDARATETALNSGLPGIDRESMRRFMEGYVIDNEDFKQLWLATQPLYTVAFDPEEARRKAESIRFRYQTHNYTFQHVFPGWDIVDRLKEIQVPVLVTVGRHDWITPVEASEELHRHLPDSELVIFEQSGHSPQFEEKAKYLATVRDFIRRKARW
jgi:proline-specific peptidase